MQTPEDDAGAPDILDRRPLRFLVGTTASGKTGLGLRLAEALDAEIVSLDSMGVYRGMDVGTAKPTVEERARVPHHLIDVADPAEPFDTQRYVALVREALAGIEARGRTALFVGGTGLYLAALVRGMFDGPPSDPEVRARIRARADEIGAEALHAELRAVDPASAERIHPADTRRVTRALEVLEQTGRPMSEHRSQWAEEGPGERERRARIVGLAWDVPVIDARIRARTREMLAGGWPDEAVRLENGGGPGRTASQALGYREALALARGELSFEEAHGIIARRTRQFARRQRTWFRKFDVAWVPGDAPDLLERALSVLGGGGAPGTPRRDA